jgi:hypothetical protein
VRRRFTEAVLESVYIEDGKVSRAEFTEVFGPFLTAEFE